MSGAWNKGLVYTVYSIDDRHLLETPEVYFLHSPRDNKNKHTKCLKKMTEI